jgi:hypothetical protein
MWAVENRSRYDHPRLRYRLTLAALTPKRSPAARCDRPAATAAKTLTRRSTERAVAISAGLRPGGKLESSQR